MINRISFTGKETVVTEGVEKAAKKVASKAEEYIGVGHIFEEVERTPVQKGIDSLYTSPFANIKDRAMAVKKAIVDGDSFSYAISHGTPEDIAKEASTGFQAIV